MGLIVAWSIAKPQYGAFALPITTLLVLYLLTTVTYGSAALAAGLAEKHAARQPAPGTPGLTRRLPSGMAPDDDPDGEGTFRRALSGDRAGRPDWRRPGHWPDVTSTSTGWNAPTDLAGCGTGAPIHRSTTRCAPCHRGP